MTFRKNSLAIIIALLLFFITIPGNLYAKDRPASGNSCLWKVTSQSNTLYLLGSIHFLKKDHYPLPQSMESAFSDSSAIIFEIDLDSAEESTAKQNMMMRGMYPPGQKLKSHIPTDTYDLVRQKAGEMGIRIELLEPFKPWFVSLSMLSMKLIVSGFKPEYGIDRHFFSLAKEQHKDIISLETLDEQISMFDGLSKKDQEKLLLQTLRELDVMDKEVNNMVEAWGKGDAEKLASLVLLSFQEHPTLYNRIILERNRTWSKHAESLLEQRKNYLMVVGVGHLVGKNGLVEILKSKGYSVTQL